MTWDKKETEEEEEEASQFNAWPVVSGFVYTFICLLFPV